MASPFCEKYWSWFKEKQAEGFEIISFALRRPPFTTLPLEQIEFAGKVNVGVVLQDYLVNSFCLRVSESQSLGSLGSLRVSGMLYSTSLNPMFFKNIANVGSFHFHFHFRI